ncbi:kinase-like protein [Aulographum hederae CBS 113979]|uniref:EKC/KEOPS complex subunit BUD32 n=1 Tax=Aulographum hederae CBS 113979 TaxID=1176131 RepID=A0A6G1HAY1_9PEZI|nr:kinase-like protein [Aulographum hederae CBS 113979]
MSSISSWFWYPEGVKECIDIVSSCYIGLIDDSTVLKFPHMPPESKEQQNQVAALEHEEKVLRQVGHHPRVVQFKGKHEYGNLLEHVPNKCVGRYLKNAACETPQKLRLKWAWQAAEAVAYTHFRNVIHCDISAGNIVIDRDLSAKLCDFQGMIRDTDGTVLLSRSRVLTDIFGLGTTIYYMVTGQLPFPELDGFDHEEEILRRFKEREFPELETHRGGDVVRKYWTGAYENAMEAVQGLKKLDCE